MAALDYLPKLKRDLGITFGSYFLEKDFLFNTLSIDKSSMSYLFFLLMIPNKMCY